MGTPSWIDAFLAQPWPAYALGALLAAGGLRLGWWALWGDRARGRRRCPKCWYDLRGTPGRRCSECGYEARSERKLHKSRRRWGWALLASTAVVGALTLGLTPKTRRDGWLSPVPTSILLFFAPQAGREARVDAHLQSFFIIHDP